MSLALIRLGERFARNINDQLLMKPQHHIEPAAKADEKLDLSILDRQEKWKSFAKNAIRQEPPQDPLTSGAVYFFILLGSAITGYFAYELCGWLLKLGVPL